MKKTKLTASKYFVFLMSLVLFGCQAETQRSNGDPHLLSLHEEILQLQLAFQRPDGAFAWKSSDKIRAIRATSIILPTLMFSSGIRYPRQRALGYRFLLKASEEYESYDFYTNCILLRALSNAAGETAFVKQHVQLRKECLRQADKIASFLTTVHKNGYKTDKGKRVQGGLYGQDHSDYFYDALFSHALLYYTASVHPPSKNLATKKYVYQIVKKYEQILKSITVRFDKKYGPVQIKDLSCIYAIVHLTDAGSTYRNSVLERIVRESISSLPIPYVFVVSDTGYMCNSKKWAPLFAQLLQKHFHNKTKDHVAIAVYQSAIFNSEYIYFIGPMLKLPVEDITTE